MLSYQSVSRFSLINPYAGMPQLNKNSKKNLLNGGYRPLVAGLLFFLSVAFSLPAFAADVTLAWDPNSESDLEGYGVYFSQNDPGPPYNLSGYVALSDLSTPSAPTFTVTGLENGGRYHFAVTAYDTSGNESSFSISICADVGDVITPCPSSDTGGGGDSGSGSGGGSSTGGSGSSGGGGGGGCFIQSAAVNDIGLSPRISMLTVIGCVAASFWIRRKKAL
jgi:uncharacterized membrane protein YgcG